jgi:hypothetical protein
MGRILAGLALLGAAAAGLWVRAGVAPAPIRFAYRPLPFTLENAETPRRYAPETMAGGVAAFDYDNDGNLDLYFANGADMLSLRKNHPKFRNRLLRGDGKGGFTDVTERAGVAGSGYDTGVAVGDYDNDGCQDIFLGGVHRNTLYHNNCDGTFRDVTERAGLARPDNHAAPLWSVGAAWLDGNNDGRLDLFVVNYLLWDAASEPLCEYGGKPEYCHPRYYKGSPNSLYLNNGDGTFTDVSSKSGIGKHIGKGMGVGVADYDRDGLPDVFVANDTVFNFLFHNRGGGAFEETAFYAGVALPEHGNFISGMGVDFRDIDNDGWPDIVYVALDNETFPLFHNTGKGFKEITFASGVTQASRRMGGYSPGIFDFDNDGWKDLFVSRGHVQSPNMRGRLPIEQPNSVFRNLGDGKYEPVAEAGFSTRPPLRHRGSAFGDFNHDGRVDVVVTALGAEAELWINESPGGNHWLDLKLEGTVSNRAGIGATIQVVTRSGAQYNHVTTAVGYASSSAGPVHFGLGKDEMADRIDIRWPSGKTQQMKNVKAGQVLKVKEP